MTSVRRVVGGVRAEITRLRFNSSIYITGAQTGKIDEAAAIYLVFFFHFVSS